MAAVTSSTSSMDVDRIAEAVGRLPGCPRGLPVAGGRYDHARDCDAGGTAGVGRGVERPARAGTGSLGWRRTPGCAAVAAGRCRACGGTRRDCGRARLAAAASAGWAFGAGRSSSSSTAAGTAGAVERRLRERWRAGRRVDGLLVGMTRMRSYRDSVRDRPCARGAASIR